DSYYDDFCPIDLPWFLGNVFSEAELKGICAKLLEQNSQLRAQFTPALTQSLFRGSNEDAVKRLSKPQTMQVVLMARDREIVAAIDECIEKGGIAIPATEIRKSPVDFQYRTWADSHFECSRLGLRIVGDKERASPSERLNRLIRALYRDEADAKQLGWRLRHIAGSTLGQKLESFISTESPTEILRQFVFVSEGKLQSALTYIRAGHLLADNFEEESL